LPLFPAKEVTRAAEKAARQRLAYGHICCPFRAPTVFSIAFSGILPKVAWPYVFGKLKRRSNQKYSGICGQAGGKMWSSEEEK